MTEQEIESSLIAKLCDLKYTFREDIRDRAALERNFREKLEDLNRVHLTDAEFHRLLEKITTPDELQLISGVPVVQVKLKTLPVDARGPCKKSGITTAMLGRALGVAGCRTPRFTGYN